MDCVVALVDQRLPEAADEVNTTLFPAQNVVGPPAVIVGTGGFGLTVTDVAVEFPEVHPATICSTVYEPVVVTVMDCVVSPVDHKLLAEAEDVNMTEPPEQNVVGPPAVITGTEGIGFTVTLVAGLIGLVHPFASVI